VCWARLAALLASEGSLPCLNKLGQADLYNSIRACCSQRALQTRAA